MTSFFKLPEDQKPKVEPAPEKERPPEPKIDPRLVIIDGSNLIKVVPDNTEIKEGKVDMYHPQMGMLVPVNYDPLTGEMI